MTFGVGGGRRGAAVPTQQDRARTVARIRRCGTEGLLSSRESDERIEDTFRARTVAELDSVVSGLPKSPHIAADMVLTHGLPASGPKARAKAGPWWRGIVAWSLAVNALWLIIWVIWGGSFGYVVLAMVCTTLSFTLRLVSRHRRLVRGTSRRRRVL